MTELIKHNKKRNVGLIYEFFSRYISKAIIENRDKDIQLAKTLLKKHFNQSTDLYKELNLFKALYETKVSSRESAMQLINRIKEVVKIQSQARLDLEKTSLIHEINQTLHDIDFFNQNIQNYKTFATIQVLLNSWRSSSLTEQISETYSLEDKIIEHLVDQSTTKPNVIKNVSEMTTTDIDRLMINILTEKINNKFSSLNDEQKKIINLYVFSNEDSSVKTELIQLMKSIQEEFLENKNSKNMMIYESKFHEVEKRILNEYSKIEELSDDLVSFYLGISNLNKEMRQINHGA